MAWPRKYSFALVMSLIGSVLLASPGSAIENGDSALGHPRIISTNPFGGSAFLYSDRIVFTQGHSVYGMPLSFFAVARPGTVTNKDQELFKVVKAFVAEGYREWNPKYDWARPNDFAILILDKPIADVQKASLASEEEINDLRATGATVSVGGYGYQSAEDRYSEATRHVEPKISSHQFATGSYLTTAMVAQMQRWPGFSRGQMPDYLKYHTLAPLGGPSTCDGDSGSGYFIEEAGLFTYLGTQGAHIGITNCGIDAPLPGIVPLQGINPVYRYLDLIAEAESWVAANPVRASFSKQKTIAGFTFTNSSPTNNQQKEIYDWVYSNPENSNLICAEVRHFRRTSPDVIQVLGRARAACEYAVSLKPSLSTLVQSEPIQAKRGAGKVLLRFD